MTDNPPLIVEARSPEQIAKEKRINSCGSSDTDPDGRHGRGRDGGTRLPGADTGRRANPRARGFRRRCPSGIAGRIISAAPDAKPRERVAKTGKRQQITITIPPDMPRRLDALAEESGQTRAGI
jgi:hypothetical protein